MMFKRVGVFVGTVLLGTLPASAATLRVSPDSQNAVVGNGLTVGVVVSELGEFSAPAVGAFDLALVFDSTILNFVGIDFGPSLGDVAANAAVSTFNLVGGELTAVEVSLLPPADLIALQPGSFALFTVTFEGVDAGTSLLTLELNTSLADELGLSLAADVVDGSVNVFATGVIFADGFESGDLNQWSAAVGLP